MNTFVTIVELYTFPKVKFYSVLVDGEALPMGMNFLNTHGKHKHFQVLMAWIKKIGNNYAASQHYFRQERTADALPPPINITHKKCSLRWYCLRVSPSAVILFDGGSKTTKKAQDCPNVSDHFENANIISEAIWEAYDEGNISLDHNDRLDVADNLKLEVKNLK